MFYTVDNETEGSITAVDTAISGDHTEFFLAMAEGIKLPLQHIARLAELHLLQPAIADASGLEDIQSSADMSLHMLDSYLLGLRLSRQPKDSLALEPVSVSAVLYDTANELRAIAKNYGVVLNLHVHGRYEPVMANSQALRSAMVSLGYALIEALPAAGVGKQHLQLATHRTKQGIVAGVYGELQALTPQLYRRAQQLQGHVRQPLVGSLPGSGAGIFVAETILAAMASRLRVGRFMKLPGFAVTLPTSKQLQLV